MAYKALYRKYRPLTFSEVVGQEHITETLKGELRRGKISHAYLFTGTRGTGKTSCAKILARAVNCLTPKNGDPCLECEACRLALGEEATDIVEMDAASNNSVEDVRLLREQITFTPSRLKYRVYIIDEVHMLSSAAFNALLKTLEEPPEHVIFILATTEVQKLPATILSRCQRFDFHRIEPDKIKERIFHVADEEGFKISEVAAGLIAAAADGGMRDALSILDLCLSAGSDITEQTVTSALGMSGNEYLNRIATALLKSDAEDCLNIIDTLYKSSVDMLRLANDISSYFRDIMIVKTVSGDKKPIVCSSEQLEVYTSLAESFDIRDVMRILSAMSDCAVRMQSSNRRAVLELTLIRLCDPALNEDYASLEKRVRILESSGVRGAKPTPTEEKEVKKEIAKEIINDVTEEEIPLPEEENAPTVPQIGEDEPIPQWSEILKLIGRTSPLMVGVLNGSRAFVSGDYLLIDAPNEQFRDLINKKDSFYRDSIRNAAKEVLGRSFKLGPYRKKADIAEDTPLQQLAEKLKKFEIPKD